MDRGGIRLGRPITEIHETRIETSMMDAEIDTHEKLSMTRDP